MLAKKMQARVQVRCNENQTESDSTPGALRRTVTPLADTVCLAGQFKQGNTERDTQHRGQRQTMLSLISISPGAYLVHRDELDLCAATLERGEDVTRVAGVLRRAVNHPVLARLDPGQHRRVMLRGAQEARSYTHLRDGTPGPQPDGPRRSQHSHSTVTAQSADFWLGCNGTGTPADSGRPIAGPLTAVRHST